MENRKGEAAVALPPGGNSAARRTFYFLCAIFLATIAAAGCAAPSEPTARHAPTPTAVTDLAAVEQGHRVILSFTLPKKTTDSKPLPPDLSIEIYRQVVPASTKPATIPAFAPRDLAVTIPSAMVSHYADAAHFEFPFELKTTTIAEPPGEQTLFMVRTRVNEKKVSANSNPATVHLYEPFPPAKISAKITHDAIILTGWGVALPTTPPAGVEPDQFPSDAHYRIFRTETETESTTAPKAESPAARGNETPSTPHLEQIADLPLTTMTYEDTNFTFDHTYIYSVRTAAKFGSTWIESDDSNLLTVTPQDIFPPSAPQGIVIVYVPAATSAPAHLEISWSISPETDLAGYDIYRKEQGNNTALKLNSRPLLTPSYRDMNIQPGISYSYTVKAIDRAGYESPASEPASTDVPAAGEPDQNSQP